MLIAKIIIYLNIVFWLLPPLRQYKTKYFLFFLVLALSDPINILFITLIKYPVRIYPLFAFAGLAALFPLENRKKIYYLIILEIVLIYFVVNSSEFMCNILLTLFFVITLLVFVRRFIRLIDERKEINVFVTMLIFYYLTLILKMPYMTFRVSNGFLFFYLTGAFEIIFALYFTLATEERPLWKIKLNMSRATEYNDSPS